MTPQELMDLPGYGDAEKWLRQSGQWKLTKEERLESLQTDLEEVHYCLEGTMNKLEELCN